MKRWIILVLPVLIVIACRTVWADSFALTWTASGDDGSIGTAAEYDLRYSTELISESNWGNATRVSGLPQPKPAGSLELFTVEGLEPDLTYFFAIKVADEAGNWSPLSNIAIKPYCPENCIGLRGNVNGDKDDRVDIADLVYLVHYALGQPPGPAPRCPEEADVDGSSQVNIADLVLLCRYTIGNPPGEAPVPCD